MPYSLLDVFTVTEWIDFSLQRQRFLSLDSEKRLLTFNNVNEIDNNKIGNFIYQVVLLLTLKLLS